LSYDQQTWADDEAGDTPITAAKLNHIEQGIEDAAVVADQATTALASKADVSYVDAIGSVDSIAGVMRRDGSGNTVANAVFLNAPVEAANQAARKDYVDAIGTTAATANTVVRRNEFSGSDFVYLNVTTPPANGQHAANKDYVDGIGKPGWDGDLANNVVRRDPDGQSWFARAYATSHPPVSNDEVTRKDYVDAAIAAAVAGLSSGGTTTYPALGKMRAGLAARNTFPFRIVFAGSSTTAGSNATTTANRYVNRLVAMMQSAYPALSGSETTVVNSTTATLGTLSSAGGVHGYNVGESSTTSATYLDATERTNVGNANPRVIVHMIGANDYGNNLAPATFKTNVLTVVNDLKSKTAGPCVQILVHTYARPDVTAPTYAWSLYGAQLKQIADADPDNVAFIDISEVYRVSDISGTDPLNLIDTDLLHQTDQGHALMADLIWQGFGMQPLAASAAASTGSGSGYCGRQL
jgi:lysophospholipase L1-like esterase